MVHRYGLLHAVFFGTFFTIPFAGGNGGEVDPAAAPFIMLGVLVPFLVFGAMFIGGALFMLYGLIGAIQVFQGKDFRYIIIGNRLEAYLRQKS
jgi:hypothetical protein